jgi:threonine dehydrogenase-like Zn-dependent dehydrogenase
MTIIAAKHLGAETLFAIDRVPERLAIAARFGAIPLNASLKNVKEEIFNHTYGRGADAGNGSSR